MRIINTHDAWPGPKQARKATVVLVVIVAVVVLAALAGHGTAAVVTVALAALTVAVEELLRAALRYWLRVA
ncbi:hypothetical protein [Streptomyces aurantiogriseus]|uniref:Uncharacterized protein n=1 Tax=Streptomyces aurantiogriseus TaxID=66870 RepID=A0A918EZG3_9ACTN|nr:hypothetical protein [Streptomyces aurantiogriseus]GGQ93850.1 hypothetical protein GCM10010251_05800 [Streptomyces aurantiogriseus]